MKNKHSNSELRNFYIFVTGEFVSEFGSKLTSFGLILWSYKQSGSVLSMSLISVCYLVPEVLLNFIAGSISDSWDKKKIILLSDTIAAVFSLGIIIMLFLNMLRIDYLYFINFVLGVTDAFQYPASEVMISSIVSKDNYIKTSGIRTFCDSVTGISSPVVTTSLYAFCGLEPIVTIDLLTFVFNLAVLIFFVKVPKLKAVEKINVNRVFSQCKFGMQYLFKNRGMLNLILFMAFVNLIAAIYDTNLAPMVLSRSGNNDIELGIVSSAESIAGLLGSILVSKMPEISKKIPLILNSMAFSFLTCNLLLGIGRNYYVWTAAIFAGSLLVPLLMANVDYIMRTNVPYEIQGRVFSARNTLQYTSIPVGNLLGGLLSDKVFEPFMKHNNMLTVFLSKAVGSGKGSGIAVLYVWIAALGFIGCSLFKLSKSMKNLDN